MPTELPPPDYPEYAALREQAGTAAARPVDPGKLRTYEQLAGRDPWASRVLGFYCHGIRHISHTDAELLALADAAGVDPPEPAWMAEDRRRGEERRRAAAETAQFLVRRDQENWASALQAAAPGITLSVFPNTSYRVRHGRREQLGHAVPDQDVYSGTRTIRVHAAGRALCETPTRWKALNLESSPTTGPATCVSCLKWTTKVRAAR